MSVTVSTCEEICNSPTNQSPSKMLFSFPKQQRFAQQRRILCDKYYQLGDTFSQRTATFGFGNKYDFTKESPASPPANSYTLPNQFSKSAQKGFSFGEGREEMLATGPLVDTVHNKNPGPGTYEIPRRNVITYSLSSKLSIANKEQLKIPGPGQYSVTFSINEKGKYFLAKYKNSCVRDFSKILGRKEALENKQPGPGAYDTSRQDLSPQGRYVMSKQHNCLTRTFGNSQRSDVAFNKFTPGPGNYRLPSQFGHYTSKAAFRKTVSSINPRAKGDDKENATLETH